MQTPQGNDKMKSNKLRKARIALLQRLFLEGVVNFDDEILEPKQYQILEKVTEEI